LKNKPLRKSTSDLLIDELIKDIRYKIHSSGCIETTVPAKGGGKVPWRTINFNKTFQGYCRITYKGHTIQVHRIIYAACNGPLEIGKVINHIDGNPSNNASNNLEQLTQRKNIAQSKNPTTIRKIYTEEFKNMVRTDHSKGLSYRELTLKYSIPKGTVYSFLFLNTKKLVA
jgi:HNH endonuclease